MKLEHSLMHLTSNLVLSGRLKAEDAAKYVSLATEVGQVERNAESYLRLLDQVVPPKAKKPARSR